MKRLILTLITIVLFFGLINNINADDQIDLYIKNVSISKEIIFENDSFFVNVEIYVKNIKFLNNPTNIFVSLFWDKPSRFTHIDTKNVEINDVDKIKISFNVDLTKKTFVNEQISLIGDKTLIVQVDSCNNIEEFNEENNTVEKKIHIFKLSSTIIKIWINKITAFVNNKEYKLETPPIIINNRTMVPLRFIVENLGGEIYWYEEELKITILFPKKTIVMWINNTLSYVNGEKYFLESPPIIIDGRTLVPVRFIAEALGSFVFWNPIDQGVVIIYEK